MENIVSTVKSFELIGKNMHPTPKQLAHFLNLIDQKGTPDEQLQRIYNHGLFSDLLDGNVDEVNREEFRAVLGLGIRKEKPQRSFMKNEHGHIEIEITGMAFNGLEESKRLLRQGIHIEDGAWEALRDQAEGSDPDWSYDKFHRLEDGKRYRLVLVPLSEFSPEEIEKAREEFRKKCVAGIPESLLRKGYDIPLAGMAPRLCEVLSASDMQAMELEFLAFPHQEMSDFHGNGIAFEIYEDEGDMTLSDMSLHRTNLKNGALVYWRP